MFWNSLLFHHLNPFEHMWDELDRHIPSRPNLPTTPAEIGIALQDISPQNSQKPLSINHECKQD